MQQAHVLGWVVELVRASHSLINEIVGLKPVHKGNNLDDGRGHPPQKWAEKHGLGSMAVNDALLLQHGVHIVVKKYFKVSAMCLVYFL